LDLMREDIWEDEEAMLTRKDAVEARHSRAFVFDFKMGFRGIPLI